MLLAIRFFTALDAVAKALVRHYSTPQVEWARFSGQLVRVMLILGPQPQQSHRLPIAAFCLQRSGASRFTANIATSGPMSARL